MDVLLYTTLSVVTIILAGVSFNTELKNFWMYAMVAWILSGVLGLFSAEITQLGCTATACAFYSGNIYGFGYFWFGMIAIIPALTVMNLILVARAGVKEKRKKIIEEEEY